MEQKNGYYHASGLNKIGYKKNIADMGGNFGELTAEKSNTTDYNRIYRGRCAGDFSSEKSSASVRDQISQYWCTLDISFRVALFIK